jgi:hypothetical protein
MQAKNHIDFDTHFSASTQSDSNVIPLRPLPTSSPVATEDLIPTLDADVPPPATRSSLGSAAVAGASGQSQSKQLVNLMKNQCELFCDRDGKEYALFNRMDKRAVLPLQSESFNELMSHQYFEEYDTVPAEQSARTAVRTLAAHARYHGTARDVYTRVAKTSDGNYWLDLCNERGDCVHLTAAGWELKPGEDGPCFVRTSSMRPLPTPEKVPSAYLDKLLDFINVPKDAWPLLVAWLLEALRPDTPYPLLELTAGQGSGKSSTQSILRRLIDPNKSNLRGAPRSSDDLFVQAGFAHMVSLENLSYLEGKCQDALCVLATGGGHAKRQLYTNFDEVVIDLKKPVVLNGISVVVTQQDLVDRTVHVDLPPITDSRRMARDLDREFDEQHGKLVGALLALFCESLNMLPSVEIPPSERPRMADFAELGEAASRVRGNAPGEFLSRYNESRSENVQRTIDSSPIGTAIMQLMAGGSGFAGTVGMLMASLEEFKISSEGWPKSAKSLADLLRRLAPGLGQIGILVDQPAKRTNRGYTVTLSWVLQPAKSVLDI